MLSLLSINEIDLTDNPFNQTLEREVTLVFAEILKLEQDRLLVSGIHFNDTINFEAN